MLPTRGHSLAVLQRHTARTQSRSHPRPLALTTRACFSLQKIDVVSNNRPRFQPQARWHTTITPDEVKDSGHIAVQSNESVLFFDSEPPSPIPIKQHTNSEDLFPLKLNILGRLWKTDRDVAEVMRRFDTSSFGLMDPIGLVKSAVPNESGVKVTEILPRLKDGGAYVKFSHDASTSSKDIEARLVKKLEEQPLKPWFNPFRRIKARLVKGTPWLEDLYRYPTKILRVEFVPPTAGQSSEELSEEHLYSLFRRYGKIADILPQPNDSKVTPRYAQIGFPRIRDSIMARNCLHGIVVDEAFGGGKTGTRLRLSYQKRVKSHSIWNWLTNHPRIVVPIMAALLAGISVMVFDPIREFFIKVHIEHSLKLTESRIYKWLKAQTDSLHLSGMGKARHDGLSTVWNHRRDLIEQLQSWIDGSSDTFIVVTGPKGSGKIEMVMDQSLKGRKNVLMIDCKPIVEARGESGIIKRLATAVGYRPVFSWANNVSSMVDLAVQSTTGVKAGFSETMDSQVNKILHTTASALKDVALSNRSSKDKDTDLSEDAYLEAHPEQRPVVVIDNFLHKADDKTIIYDKVAEWAASVVQNNVGHVIFLTSDSSFTKTLSKALPDRVFREISLGDLDAEVAKKYVVGRLDEDAQTSGRKSKKDESDKPTVHRPDLDELDSCIQTLGGRLTDLEFLSRRLKTGQSPRAAVDEIVNESATDISKMFLIGKVESENKKWSIQQAWLLVKSLAESPTLRYNQVLLSPTFASSITSSASDGEAALESLTSSELISVKFHRGRPQSITAAKPLYQAAFSALVRDPVLKAKMDLGVLSEEAKIEARTIDSAEKELALLGSLPNKTYETSGRISYLLTKLDGSQVKITKLEKEMAGLKRILNEEY